VLIGERTLGGLICDLTWMDDASAFVASGVARWQGVVLVCRLDQAPRDWAMLDLGPAGRTMTRVAVAISANGARLVAAGDGGSVARVFDLQDAESAVKDLHGHDQRIRDVALTADGRRIATAGEDSTVRLWELGQVEPVVLTVVNGSAGRLAFRGNRLLAVAESGVHRWNLDLDELIALAASSASRNLSPDEWNRFLFGAPRATFSEFAEE
jgi:WD40 repeat protein